MTSSQFSLASRVKLSNGLNMPLIQLGVYMSSPGQETYNAVKWALEAGYRAIDSAQMYHNEASAGEAILSFLSSPAAKSQNLTRADIHFTTKLETNMSYERARKSISDSVKRCGLGYIDLFLLHSPYGGREKRRESWRALEDALDEGDVRMAGVSNYGVAHLQELLTLPPRHHPVINQIEVHPFNTQRSIVSFCEANAIQIEAYAPLVRGMRFTHPVIRELSKKYGCTPAQILIRWGLQRGYVVLPKSIRKERILENAQVMVGVEAGEEGTEEGIGEGDMASLDGLDEHLVTDWDPTDAE